MHESHPEYTKDDEEDDLEEMPVAVVCNLEQYELPSAVRIHRLSTYEVKQRIGK